MNLTAFEKLKPEKRKRITNSAFNEFSNNSYDKVSVFQIAKNANISRASFYSYFTDKRDVYIYLLESLQKEIFDKFNFINKRVDPFDFILYVFNELSTYKNTDKQKFIEQMLSNFTPLTQGILFKEDCKNAEMPKMIDISKYKFNEKLDFATIFDMLFYGLWRKLSSYYNDKLNKAQTLNEFVKIVNYSKYGVIRENTNA